MRVLAIENSATSIGKQSKMFEDYEIDFFTKQFQKGDSGEIISEQKTDRPLMQPFEISKKALKLPSQA